MKYIGVVLMSFGLVALIPFKVDYLEKFDTPIYVVGGIGLVMLLRASQKIGWHLVLEDNVLYYSKFNMFYTWKRIRANEFALSKKKITSVALMPGSIEFHYQPGRTLSFNTFGLDRQSKERLKVLRSLLVSKTT